MIYCLCHQSSKTRSNAAEILCAFSYGNQAHKVPVASVEIRNSNTPARKLQVNVFPVEKWLNGREKNSALHLTINSLETNAV